MDHEIFDIITGRLAVAERGFLASGSFADDESVASEQRLMKEDRTLLMDKEAQIQTENGDYDAAVATLTKALAVRRKRLTKRLKRHGWEPNLKEKNDVAKTIGNFAAVLYMKGELKQAEALFTEAIRVYRSNGMDDENPCTQDLLYGLERLHEDM
jgi:tetratricopeptide (TPR) repeat protein